MTKYLYKSIESLENQDETMPNWYRPKIDIKLLKKLSKRSNGPAWINTILYFGVLLLSGSVAYLSWGTWWAIPAFFVYGTIFAFNASRWHEYGHRSVFKTRGLNDFFYEISSFLACMESVQWRWSHTHHHSRTIHVGIDYEGNADRPPKLFNLFFLDMFGIRFIHYVFKDLSYHSLGILSQAAKDYVPAAYHSKMMRNARLYLLFIIFLIYISFAVGSFLPLMFFVLPNLYGRTLLQLIILLQHDGLKANTWDHRESTRTVHLNFIYGYLLYFNMQYHVEHHIFPQVPFNNLPALHKAIKDQLPPAKNGLIDGLIEVIPAIIKQSKDPNYFIQKVFTAPR